MKKTRFIKLISIFFALLLLSATLVSCQSNKALTVVGKVGEFEVRYEELYFLSVGYAEGLEAKYGEYSSLDAAEAAKFDGELRELVYENIVTNHAILTLCKEYGLTLDAEGLDKRIDKYVDSMVATEFDGSRSDYKRSLEAYGMTENYVEFTAAVDLLYADLLTKLLEDGVIADDDAEVLSIIENEFICTWHIMVANDEGDDVDANRALIEEAARKYANGTMSMYDLIGSNYNEDFSVPFEGNYFTKGYAEKEYEDAAFALEIGEISDVIECRGINANGQKLSCFYLIKRLPLDMEYIKTYFYELEEIYRDGIMAAKLDEVRDTLEFEPNEYCQSLSLSSLDAPKTLSTALIIVSVAASLVVLVVVVIIIAKKKKNALIKK